MSGVASAGPISVDAGWYGFCFEDVVGAPATTGCRNESVGEAENDITFSALSDVELHITDAFLFGDRFSVVINGVTQSPTSVPTLGGTETNSPDAAFADANYSRGVYFLNPGDYVLQIYTLEAPSGGGGAYLRVVTAQGDQNAVPEPLTLSLFGAGLAGLALRRRRKA